MMYFRLRQSRRAAFTLFRRSSACRFHLFYGLVGAALQHLDHIRRQDCYDGEIYPVGGSYLSTVHLSYLSEQPADVKGAVLNIQTADGSALPEDITVEVKQTAHKFKFGANLFMLDECETAEKNAIYREKFPEFLNLATLPFYWSDLEPEEGKPRFAADSPKVYRRPATDLCVDYCLENGIEPWKMYMKEFEGEEKTLLLEFMYDGQITTLPAEAGFLHQIVAG